MAEGPLIMGSNGKGAIVVGNDNFKFSLIYGKGAISFRTYILVFFLNSITNEMAKET